MSGDKGREIICQTSSDRLFYRPRVTYPNSPLSSGCLCWPSDGPLGSQISISILESKNRGGSSRAGLPVGCKGHQIPGVNPDGSPCTERGVGGSSGSAVELNGAGLPGDRADLILFSHSHPLTLVGS